MLHTTKIRILFVCLGNICRSPAAEIVCRATLLNAGLTERVEVDSCGTAAYHVGCRPDSRMLAALRHAGYEYGGHLARQLRKRDGEEFNFIVPQDDENLRDVKHMLHGCKAHIIPMCKWFPRGCDLHEVPDPYYGDAADFESVVQLLADSMPRFLEDVRAWLSE